MRNFSQSVPCYATCKVSASGSNGSYEYESARSAILLAMDANPDMLVPSEESVMESFLGWYVELVASSRKGAFNFNPVFVYINLNDGRSAVVLAVDEDGEILSVH